MQADRVRATRVRLHSVVSRRCMICQKVGVVAGLLTECASWRDRGAAQMHDSPAGRQVGRLAGGIGIAKPGDDRCRMIGWARSRRTPEWQGECVGGADAPRVPICPVSDSPGFDLSRSVLICPVCPVSGPSGPVPPRFARLDLPSLCRKLVANWAHRDRAHRDKLGANWAQTGQIRPRIFQTGRIVPSGAPKSSADVPACPVCEFWSPICPVCPVCGARSQSIVCQSSVNRPRNSNFPAGLLECRQAISEIRVLWTVIDSHRQPSTVIDPLVFLLPDLLSLRQS